ncbi:galactokinase [Pseudonocardia eucalypti]|uniref:Galactokinase n=1 Tax=Pseudonocardia eucalypti TaxID=648755 RepID=A0ABP9QF65_9PSEU|nr:galactokinase [Pseudonocardia eucalypti]
MTFLEGGPALAEIHWHPPSSPESAARAEALFASSFDGAPAGVWSAPGRANLIGEHVDYVGGICLPLALPQRTWLAVRPRTDGLLRLVSGQCPEVWQGAVRAVRPGHPRGWPAYLAGVVWALISEGLLPAGFGGVDVAVHSDVPLGAGLSSSAALECALAVALAELFGSGSSLDTAGRSALVKACIRAENEIALAATGGMDQTVALHARTGHCLRLDCDSGAVDPLPLPLDANGLVLLVINTNAPHRLVDGQYRARRVVVERAARLLRVPTLRRISSVQDAVGRLAALGEDDPELLRRVRHAISETARAGAAARLLVEGRLAELGPLLDASHTSLREDYEVSSLELDNVVDAAKEAGALGARMVGGGFGGSALALVETAAVPAVTEAVLAATEAKALPTPTFLHALPGPSAARWS